MTITVDALEASLKNSEPPAALPTLVRALWYERHGDWTRAHEIAQDIDTENAAWVHAYLHRREGDLANARYWYRHAGRPPATGSFDEEWRAIVSALLTSPTREH